MRVKSISAIKHRKILKRAKGFKQARRIRIKDAKEALTCGLVVALRAEFELYEDRYVYLGMCKKLKILVVVVSYPEDEITRIISARKATKREVIFYETQL